MNEEQRQRLTIHRFEAQDIDAESFDHESHVYVAWLYVQKFGLAGALGRFDKAISDLVQKFGAEDKYHATITWLFLLLIGERIEAGEPWQQFKSRNEDLLTSGRELLSRYYDEETLFSTRARSRFILPNNLLL